MGSSGIRRRKQSHHLPKVHDGLPQDEEAHALGEFRWSGFSPAGALERSGFFIRQAARRSEHPEWREHNRITVTIGWSLLVVIYGALAVVLLLGLMHTTVGIP
jgi:hypothetical protein